MLTLHWGTATDVGRVREINEDSLLATDRLFAVADGMGGHAAGEVASELAITELGELASVAPLSPDRLANAIGRANDHILTMSLERGDRLGMGTTLTGMAVVDTDPRQQFAVFNVGDSRVYRFADGVLSQLTVDHSEVQEMVSAGRLRPEDARLHPRRNVVTRSLGSYPPPLPDLWLIPPVATDRFLICSDGLTAELADSDIARILQEAADPGKAAAELVDSALAAGGSDNVTVVVVDVLESDNPPSESDTE
jgi:serine/threonine protein phosphatase PrpC